MAAKNSTTKKTSGAKQGTQGENKKDAGSRETVRKSSASSKGKPNSTRTQEGASRAKSDRSGTKSAASRKGTADSQRKSTGKGSRTNSAARTAEKLMEQEEWQDGMSPGEFHNELVLLVTLVVSVLLFLSNFSLSGKFGEVINSVTFGLFGLFTYVIPFLLFFGIAFYLANRGGNRRYVMKLAAAVAMFAVIAAFIQMFSGVPEEVSIFDYYKLSSENKNGGGLVGGLLCFLFIPAFGKVGTYVVLAALLAVCLMLLTGKALFALAAEWFEESAENRRETRQLRKEEGYRQAESEDGEEQSKAQSFLIKKTEPKEEKPRKKNFFGGLTPTAPAGSEIDETAEEWEEDAAGMYPQGWQTARQEREQASGAEWQDTAPAKGQKPGMDGQNTAYRNGQVPEAGQQDAAYTKGQKPGMDGRNTAYRNGQVPEAGRQDAAYAKGQTPAEGWQSEISANTQVPGTDRQGILHMENREKARPVWDETAPEGKSTDVEKVIMDHATERLYYTGHYEPSQDTVDTVNSIYEEELRKKFDHVLEEPTSQQSEIGTQNMRTERYTPESKGGYEERHETTVEYKTRVSGTETDGAAGADVTSGVIVETGTGAATQTGMRTTAETAIQTGTRATADTLKMGTAAQTGTGTTVESGTETKTWTGMRTTAEMESLEMGTTTAETEMGAATQAETEKAAEILEMGTAAQTGMRTTAEMESLKMGTTTAETEMRTATQTETGTVAAGTGMSAAHPVKPVEAKGLWEEPSEPSFSEQSLLDRRRMEEGPREKTIFDNVPYSAVTSAPKATGNGVSSVTAGSAAVEAAPERHTAAEDVAVVAEEAGNAPETLQQEAPYRFPPIELLAEPVVKNGSSMEDEVTATAEKLRNTLESFGVHVTITNVSCGPTVTRYELQPELGVKVSRITNLADDIKLNLAAADIRIEAPIPGKAAIGIEVPNKENTAVLLRELIESPEFKEHPSEIAFTVGKDIGGQNIVADIAKMPHLLIAGSTGSGKSVCINTIIMSILYRAKPSEVKLIMVDPKVVELSVYNGIPHLLIPVVTDAKKASAALNWAVAEMIDRYQKFAELGVRNLKGYNARIKDAEKVGITMEKYPILPQMVIIVDELADLMMAAPGEVEDAICRLAQMARAAGMHLIIATQRPSVNVITGVIKANVPSRIAFAVSSGIDSRTILDGVGAEKLLGKGDMLFFPSGYPKPVRIQGAFVSDKEVSAVVDFLKEQSGGSVSYNEEVSERIASGTVTESVPGAAAAGTDNNGRDEYFAEAGRFIIEKDKASIGMLQRVYKIGFNRAARIMDQLSEAGVVGPEEGTKPRKILMTQEEFEELLAE